MYSSSALADGNDPVYTPASAASSVVSSDHYTAIRTSQMEAPGYEQLELSSPTPQYALV